MRCERQYVSKHFLTILWVVVLVFVLQATTIDALGKPFGKKEKTNVTIGQEEGLHTATLETPRGKIKVNLPADTAAGDRISGTVIAEPTGKTPKKQQKNLGVLNGYVVEIEEVEDKQIPAGKKWDSWVVPAAIGTALHLVFKDGKGKEVGRTEVPVSPGPVETIPGNFELPTIGQAGKPLRCPGPFDGNLNSTAVRIGGTEAELLAESPRGLVIRPSSDVTGPTEINLQEQGTQLKGKINICAVTLSADKTSLKVGENATLTVTVKGLEGIEEEIPLRLENISTQTIRMSGGNRQTIKIHPRENREDGTFVRELPLLGLRAGSFGIVSSIISPLGGGQLQEGDPNEIKKGRANDSGKHKGTPTNPFPWEKVKASYEERGYRFVSKFQQLIGNTLKHQTPEGLISYRLEEIVMGAGPEGQLFPVRLSGPVKGASIRVEIDYSDWAAKQGYKCVESPAGSTIFHGRAKVRIQMTRYEFGITPGGGIFVAYFEGKELDGGIPARYQFSPTFYRAKALLCQLIPGNACSPELRCTTCVFTRDKKGNITGCACTAGWGFCLWFTQDCTNISCSKTCVVYKLPGTDVYWCECE
ncbi:MAG: hypothetical protein GY940_05930 [bacterium]|nr:hypothetical protein [bacterium]